MAAMSPRRILRLPAALAILAVVGGCAATPPAAPPPPVVAAAEPDTPAPPPFAAQRARMAGVSAVVDAADRSAADRALDAGRKPTEMLLYFGIGPGMRVAEFGAGGGYTTELLARAVGPQGRVYAQNAPLVLERFAEKPWSERLAKPALANVVRLDRPFDDPLPGDVRDLDAVVAVLVYHDTAWMQVDRARMNRAAFAALRPGGIYGVIDHAATPGAGVLDAETLHRIDEATVIAEVSEAGFVLEGTATFLRDPADRRDWNAAPRAAAQRRGSSDRFVLLFRKP